MRTSSKRTSAKLLSSISGIFLLTGSSQVFADQHTTGVPLLSSRPGAAYTIYLDPSGFNFNGQWSSSTPGNNLGLNNEPANGTFNAADVDEIKAIYAAMANQYRSFNVNITTVDPAIAANAAATDTARQAYYDSQPQMMHTVIGAAGNAGWEGSADGLALLGSISTVATSNGAHTNWMFTEALNGNATVASGNYIGDISAHEGGHTFGLHHQSDYTGNTLVNEYTNGDAATGTGSYVATMGNASDRQRVQWRAGSSNGGQINDEGGGATIENQQNDVKTILSNANLTYADSGIGHTFATATPLPVVGGSVDESSPLHRGIISPLSASNPNPIGASNYSQDVFSFSTNGLTPLSLTVNDGDDLLTPGTADNAATLRSTLEIFNAATQSLVATATEGSSTLLETFSGLLSSGTYYAEINSFGGHNETTANFNAAQYYDMGGYFLTGSGFTAVPEPAMLGLFAISLVGVLRRRRNVLY